MPDLHLFFPLLSTTPFSFPLPLLTPAHTLASALLLLPPSLPHAAICSETREAKGVREKKTTWEEEKMAGTSVERETDKKIKSGKEEMCGHNTRARREAVHLLPTSPPPLSSDTHTHTTKRVFNLYTHTHKHRRAERERRTAEPLSLTRSSPMSLPALHPWGGRWWLDGEKGCGKEGCGVTEGWSGGDEGLKLIWTNINTFSTPPTPSNLRPQQTPAFRCVTMTTPVNHRRAAGFLISGWWRCIMNGIRRL